MKRPAAVAAVDESAAAAATSDSQVSSDAKPVPPVKRSRSVRTKKQPTAAENDAKNATVSLTRELTTGGVLLTCGQGDVGQLGLGEDVLEKTRFAQLPSHANVVAIAGGGMHNVCLTDDGKVLTFGCNDEGALGRATTEEGAETTPGYVELPAPAVQVTAGDSHSAALLEDGRVFVWGSFRDSHGTMGLLTKENERFPIEIPLKASFVKIASGADHLVLLDQSRLVYTCGCGEQGQLGRLPERKTDRHCRQGVAQLLTPTRVFFKINKHIEVEDIWAGTYSTFLKVAGSDEVYVFGLNNYSQIGLEGTDKQYHPKVSKTFSDNKWSRISSGQHHTVALSKDGKVYVIGRKEYGRLGLGNNTKADASELTLVPSLAQMKFVDVSAGSAQTFAVNDAGKLYAWGMGTSGQLGTGEEEDVEEPALIDSKQLKQLKVVRVAGGGQHTIILGLPQQATNGPDA